MKGKKEKPEVEKFGFKRRMVYVAAFAIVVVLVVAFFFFYPNQSNSPKAAIIDQLGSDQLDQLIRHQNSTFIETAKSLLYERFSEVHYYSNNATVDQYKRLASLGYKLIIWRAHSALNVDSKYVAIATVEKYATGKYGEYLENGQLTVCNITGQLYYGITPKFVSDFMSGRFEDTVIVFMSCNGLNGEYLKTAEAFGNKGAKVFISWDEWIGPIDNDNAIARLLQYLINENNTIAQATGKIPVIYSEYVPLGTRLRYYPASSEVGSYRIPDYRQNKVASSAAFLLMSLKKNLQLRRVKLAR